MNGRFHLIPTLLALLICAIPLGETDAEMYRWVDRDGVTVYSQNPPPSGEAARIRKQPGPRAADAEAARKRLQQQLEREFDEREAKTEQAKKDAEERESAQRDSEACAAARRNLETLENLGARRAITPEGDAVFLSDKQRGDMMAKARDQIQKACR